MSSRVAMANLPEIIGRHWTIDAGNPTVVVCGCLWMSVGPSKRNIERNIEEPKLSKQIITTLQNSSPTNHSLHCLRRQLHSLALLTDEGYQVLRTKLTEHLSVSVLGKFCHNILLW